MLSMAQEVIKAKQTIKYGMPYCCIEALDCSVALAIRPEVCAIYAKLGAESCCSVLRKAASQINDSSSPNDIKKLRKYLKLDRCFFEIPPQQSRGALGITPRDETLHHTAPYPSSY